MNDFDYRTFANNLQLEGCYLGSDSSDMEESIEQLNNADPGSIFSDHSERLVRWMANLSKKYEWQITQNASTEEREILEFQITFNMFKRAYDSTLHGLKIDNRYYYLYKSSSEISQ